MAPSSMSIVSWSVVLVYVLITKMAMGSNTTILERQKSYVESLYHEMHGYDWVPQPVNWNTDASICTWGGIECKTLATGEQYISYISLPYVGLFGPMPSNAELLAPLEWIDLGGNFITSLPQSLLQLPSLQGLELYDNDIRTNFTDLSFLSTIQHIDLSRNYFRGHIPPSIGNLRDLEYFSIGFNELSGPLPSELGKLTRLRYLLIDKNRFDGSIPESFVHLQRLEVVDLKLNQFDGSFPNCFTKIPSLQSLSVAFNPSISGPLPDTWQLNTKLEVLRVRNCNMSGSLPKSIQNLKKLTVLDLRSNHFQGELIPELSLLTNLSRLEIGNNHFKGPIPAGIMRLTKMKNMDLSSNQFTAFPDNFGYTFLRLESFNGSNNHFSGLVPSGLLYNPSMSVLVLSWNNFTHLPEHPAYTHDQIQSLAPKSFVLPFTKYKPSVLSSLAINSSLYDLQISGNNLESLPISLVLLSEIRVLVMDHNDISFMSGPSTFWMIPYLNNLRVLDLSFNPLFMDWEDFILSFLANGRGLWIQQLLLADCQLYGSVYSYKTKQHVSFRKLFPSLTVWNVAHNQLDSELVKYLPPYMTDLYINDNTRISGEIPTGYSSLRFLMATNTDLTGAWPDFGEVGHWRKQEPIAMHRSECPAEYRRTTGAVMHIYIVDPDYDNYERCRCLPGAYKVGLECRPCPINTYSEEVGATECTPCPPYSTTATNGSTTVDDCICEPGYFWSLDTCTVCPENYMKLQPGRQPCDKCPEQGISCFGGPASFMPGFWRLASNISASSDFYECPVYGVCLVDQQSGQLSCLDGHTGPMCSKCLKDFGKIGDFCYECVSKGWTSLLFLLSIFLAIPLGIVLVRNNMRDSDEISIIWRITLNSCQVLSSSMSMLNDRPPEAYQHVTSWMVLSNGFQVGGYVTDCLFGWSYYESYAVQMSIPVLVIFVTALSLLFLIQFKKWRGQDATYLKKSMIPAIVILLFFLYNRLVNETLNLFNCYPDAIPDRRSDSYFLSKDMTVPCYETKAVVANSLMIAFYVIGIPAVAAILLIRNRTRLHDPDFRVRFGFIYAGYSPNFFLWEIMCVIPRKLLISAIGAFVYDGALQIFLSMCVTCLAIFFQHTFRPFEQKEFNMLEVSALYVTLVQQSFAHVYTFIEAKKVTEMPATVKRIWAVVLCSLMIFAVGLFAIFVFALLFRKGWVKAKLREVKMFVKGARGTLDRRRRSSLKKPPVTEQTPLLSGELAQDPAEA